MSILAILSGATIELDGTEYMDRAYGSHVEPLPPFNGLKSVVTTSVEATPLFLLNSVGIPVCFIATHYF